MRTQLIEFTADKFIWASESVIGEHRLYEILAIVESSFDGDIMDVVGLDRRHLPALHLRCTPRRMQYKNIDGVLVLARLDGRGAGVARRRADNGDARAPDLQHAIEHEAHRLQSVILERQRRAVKQLNEPIIGRELGERSNCGVSEGRISVPSQCIQITLKHRTRHKRRHHARDYGWIVEPRQGGNLTCV